MSPELRSSESRRVEVDDSQREDVRVWDNGCLEGVRTRDIQSGDGCSADVIIDVVKCDYLATVDKSLRAKGKQEQQCPDTKHGDFLGAKRNAENCRQSPVNIYRGFILSLPASFQHRRAAGVGSLDISANPLFLSSKSDSDSEKQYWYQSYVSRVREKTQKSRV